MARGGRARIASHHVRDDDRQRRENDWQCVCARRNERDESSENDGEQSEGRKRQRENGIGPNRGEKRTAARRSHEESHGSAADRFEQHLDATDPIALSLIRRAPGADGIEAVKEKRGERKERERKKDRDDARHEPIGGQG